MKAYKGMKMSDLKACKDEKAREHSGAGAEISSRTRNDLELRL